VPSSPDGVKPRALWYVCGCVLLVGLLLYNPFLALAPHADGLAYQALARHRATVGASELQHLAPVPGENAQPEVIVEKIFTGMLVESSTSLAYTQQPPTLLQRIELIADIWFRPPPAQ
jgi:hypothetical protein